MIKYLNNNIPDYLDKIELPVIYNLFNCTVSDLDILTNIIFEFKNIMDTNGYSTIVELGKTIFLSLFEVWTNGTGQQIVENGIVLWTNFFDIITNKHLDIMTIFERIINNI